MAQTTDRKDDDGSFIILGPTSDVELNGLDFNSITVSLNDIIQDAPENASLAISARYQAGKSPSPTSVMIASNMVTDQSSIEDLQMKFGELLDENLILKETIKQNNESMREQMMMILSTQDDLVKTRSIHRDKFMETKEAIEKLTQENAQLKQEIGNLSASFTQKSSLETSTNDTKSSVYEFVASPDDETLAKLTDQLELVEKQRRSIIVENEKLVWQKESLEKVVDGLQCEKSALERQIQDLMESVVQEKDDMIGSLQEKISGLQGDIKQLQLKVLHLENVKLEYLQQRDKQNEILNMYKNQVSHLEQRLTEVQNNESITKEKDDMIKQLQMKVLHLENVKEQQNDKRKETVSLYDTQINELKERLTEAENNSSKSNQLTVDNLTAKLLAKEEELKAGEQEIVMLRMKVREAVGNLEKIEEQNRIMAVRLDLYRTDFEAERESRETLASERECLLAELRNVKRNADEMTLQFQEVKKLNPNIYKAAIAKRLNTENPEETVYKCPKCNIFSCMDYSLIEEHVELCLNQDS